MAPWLLDPLHSTIGFSTRHMMVAKVRGSFRDFALDVAFDPEHPEQGRVTAIVQAASIDTGQEQRDTHLRSADFLAAESFPTLTFASTGVVPRGEGKYDLAGDLNIRGMTRRVTFDLEYLGEAANAQGGRSAGFSAHAKIKRHDWGLVWNQGLEAGGLAVGDEIEIEIDVELVRAAEEQVAAPVPVAALVS